MRFIDVDPNLSDFTKEEIREIAVSILIQIEETEKMLHGFRKFPEFFPDDIVTYERKLENLRTAYTQFINAGARKKMHEDIASN